MRTRAIRAGGGGDPGAAVLVSADAEWKAVKALLAPEPIRNSPYGEYFFAEAGREEVLFFQGGWGKVAAAGSTQYVIDHFHPKRLINIGTCGGVAGRIECFDIVVAEKAVICDIGEAIEDAQEAMAVYSTTLDLPARFPVPALRATMYSADRDLTAARLRESDARHEMVVADWESGAIAWVARRNGTPVLIVRGVSDLVSTEYGEAHGNPELFRKNAVRVMEKLVGDLPRWIEAWDEDNAIK